MYSYETPPLSIFNEMKNTAINIWNTYSDTYGYRSEKVNYVNSLENISDNAMVFFRMFDSINQMTFLSNSSKEVKNYINNNL